jgi:HEAT repeat protein
VDVWTMLVALVACSLIVWLGLFGLAAGRKLRRDRREQRSIERRADYVTALRGQDSAEISTICDGVRNIAAEVDLAAAIDVVRPSLSAEQGEAVGRAIEASDLPSRLVTRLGSRQPRTRARAALLLTRPGTLPMVVDQVTPLLEDPDPDVRLVACSGLSIAASPAAAGVLIWGLAAGLLPPERIIERLGAPWAVESILQALESGLPATPCPFAGVTPSHGGAELETNLARALGIARDPRGADALVKLLRGGSEEAQVSAARALGRVGGANCVPALILALKSEFWPVRAQAAKSLGALGARDALDQLEECLSDRAWWVRANCARALRELGDPGLEALRRTLEHEDRYASDRAREHLALHAVAEEHTA